MKTAEKKDISRVFCYEIIIITCIKAGNNATNAAETYLKLFGSIIIY
jgi:hypothetical protein